MPRSMTLATAKVPDWATSRRFIASGSPTHTKGRFPPRYQRAWASGSRGSMRSGGTRASPRRAARLAQRGDGIDRPQRGVAGRGFKGEEGGHPRRPGQVEQTGGRAVVLHEREPLEMVVGGGQAIELVGRLAAEDAQDALLLRAPSARVDAEGEQVPVQRAGQRPTRVGLPAEGPRGELRASDGGVEGVPGVEAQHAVGRPAARWWAGATDIEAVMPTAAARGRRRETTQPGPGLRLTRAVTYTA